MLQEKIASVKINKIKILRDKAVTEKNIHEVSVDVFASQLLPATVLSLPPLKKIVHMRLISSVKTSLRVYVPLA